METNEIFKYFCSLKGKIGLVQVDSWYPIDDKSIKIKLSTGPVVVFSLYGSGEWRMETVRCNKKWGLN